MLHQPTARRSLRSMQSMTIGLCFPKSCPLRKVAVVSSAEGKNGPPCKADKLQWSYIQPCFCKIQQGKEQALCQGSGNSCRPDTISDKIGRKENKKMPRRMVYKCPSW